MSKFRPLTREEKTEWSDTFNSWIDHQTKRAQEEDDDEE